MKKQQPPLVREASPTEVGRSLLGQLVPQTIRGRVSKRRALAAWLPLIVTLSLGEIYTLAFPSVADAWWRVAYLWLFGLGWSALLLRRNRWARLNDALAREYEYAREHLQPALHYSGVLASLAETLRLMKGYPVTIARTVNLHGANRMRLIREVDGTHAIQFELVQSRG